ncbi:hypothetical protein GCM10023189_10910 [Nibrella saemangeumensis]|uniref:Uncharacterized protein n=1 Tax=Nibrella saemangeumensis TaxID=1084526 RepID=A0ABP8MJ93_9BACT
MKKLFISLVICCLSVSVVMAQKGKNGILFREAPLEEVFQAARKAGKPVFVEIYSPTCHVCQSFVPTLNDSRVVDFYNARFISTKQDITQKATQAFLGSRKMYVPQLPLFLYFDAQGNLLHMAMSSNTANEVIRHGTNALNPGQRTQGMKGRYTKGERSPAFLIDYAMYSLVTRDTVTNMKAMEEYARQVPASDFAKYTNWLALKKLVMDSDNPLFQYFLTHQDQYKKHAQPDELKNVAENILMSSLFSSRGARYSPEKILEIRSNLAKIGIDPKVAANRTLLPEVNAFFQTRQTAKAVARMDSQVTNNPITVPEFVYITKLFNRLSPDPSDAPTVIKWVNKAFALNKATPREQSDLYYELAEAHRRAGNMAEASKAAQKSMELAQANKLDVRRNVELMQKLK